MIVNSTGVLRQQFHGCKGSRGVRVIDGINLGLEGKTRRRRGLVRKLPLS